MFVKIKHCLNILAIIIFSLHDPEINIKLYVSLNIFRIYLINYRLYKHTIYKHRNKTI